MTLVFKATIRCDNAQCDHEEETTFTNGHLDLPKGWGLQRWVSGAIIPPGEKRKRDHHFCSNKCRDAWIAIQPKDKPHDDGDQG